MKVIRAKMSGKKLKVPAESEAKDDKVLDLMSRLRESLKEAKPAAKKTTRTRAKKTTKTRKTA